MPSFRFIYFSLFQLFCPIFALHRIEKSPDQAALSDDFKIVFSLTSPANWVDVVTKRENGDEFLQKFITKKLDQLGLLKELNCQRNSIIHPVLNKPEKQRKIWGKNCQEWEMLREAYRHWVNFLFYEGIIQEGNNIKYLAIRPLLKEKMEKTGENDWEEDLLENDLEKILKIFKQIKAEGMTEMGPPKFDNQLEFEAVASWAKFCQMEMEREENKTKFGETAALKAAKRHLWGIWREERKVLFGQRKVFANEEHYNRKRWKTRRTFIQACLIDCLLPEE